MTHASLFSGIGGFDLAARNVGWTNVFHVEKHPWCRQVLGYHFPESKSYDDIKQFDATPFRGRVRVLSGGFPCQPFSAAGARAGTSDDRYLWPEMLRVISEVVPTWVVGENVRGLVSWNDGLVLDTVCADLERLGYEVFPTILPAAGVSAPHRRDRIFFLARKGGLAVDTDYQGGREELGHVSIPDGEVCERNYDTEPGYASPTDAADPDSDGLQGRVPTDEHREPRSTQEPASERVSHGREPRVRFAGFPTQSPVCGGDDGLPTELDGTTFSKWRRESIAAYGNAVCVPLIETIFQSINEQETAILR